MKVGLVTDSIEMGSPGLRRYSMRLAQELLRLDGADVTLIHRGAGLDPFYEGKPTLKVWNPRLPFAGKQMVFRRKTAPLGLDVLHDTYHFPPFLVPLPYGKVMTVADLTGLLLKTHRLKNRLAHLLLFPILVRRADHVITISEYTRQDVIRRLGISPDRVTATPLAADDHLRPVQDPAKLSEVRARFRLPEQFLLYVGTIEPRKNLTRLVEAFAAVIRHFPGLQLVLAGQEGWGNTRLQETAAAGGVAGSVRLLGRVPEEDLATLYSLATAFVFPSLYEGFGLPPLEAMQCGCPVVTSNVSSLPEVAGDAAILVDSQSTEAIAAALRCVVGNESLRRDMRERGLKQATRFSWRTCAQLTMEVYESVRQNRT